MRFGSRLRIQWSIAPETARILVPQLILQPLVENAIRHGIATSREGGWIAVSATADDGKLNVIVGNSTAVGASKSNGTGVGLRNVEARLRFLYSGDANLNLSFGDDRMATVVLRLPALQSPIASVSADAGLPVLPGKDQQCAYSSSTTNP